MCYNSGVTRRFLLQRRNNMNSVKWYGCLDTSNISDFESNLIEWVKRNGENSNMFFDEFSIRKISIKLQSEVRENNNLMMGHIYRIKPEDVYEVMTPSLKIQWINLGGSKCMLKRIITISDNKCIYHDTEKWHKTDLWYAF